ncbi:hypothetical protein, partial [Pseudoruegeria sp. SK021]|uniref:hypothetical protein n=1 Tax=Pseudoruegeria sp. SK021 TaxID=1933035 RepID=UPI00197EF085
PAPSKTIRTARSRTSGEYLFVVLFMMLHPTHELEPPANLARFTTAYWIRLCAPVRRTFGQRIW